jgi:phenylalanyl-tRNA synthetase beta chain
MKVSLSWLRDYVPVEMEVPKLVAALTMAGLEVEAVIDRYGYLETVFVGCVTGIRPHPKADRLVCCTVDTGKQTLNIVCGAPNVEMDMLTAVALPGTEMPDGTILKKGAIRGETSEGMLCSAGELALGEDRSGVMALKKDLKVGQTLKQALKLDDTTLEIDLTPNRPDCLSVIGIAREVAVIQGAQLTHPDISLPEGEGDINAVTSVAIEAADHCPRYAARLITDINIAASPFWLQDRLFSVGLRPINNIVDVTNFVMMETGQPLHAFDFDQLEQQRIVVRTAQEGEAFTTLDDKERRLMADTLMICDGVKPVAIGGVMGGLNSEIEPTSKNVLIESAYFAPTSVRKTAKRLGLNTDAAHRFERGIDPDGTLTALNRATQLILAVAGGKLAKGTIDAHPGPQTPTKLSLSIPKTNRLLGTNYDLKPIQAHLESIDFETEKLDDQTLAVTVPTFRVDVSRPEDLMEEVARLTGYNNIPTTFPEMSAQGRGDHRQRTLRNRLKNMLTGFGFTEAICYSFVHKDSGKRLQLRPDDFRQRVVPILNPISEDQAVMRTSLLPGMLETMAHNLARQTKTLKLFETGKIFIAKKTDRLPDEIEMLSGLWTGQRSESSWNTQNTPCDFFDIKGVVEGLFGALDISSCRFTALADDSGPYLRPGHCAAIVCDGQTIGCLGEIHPQVQVAYELKQPAFVFELNLNLLFTLIIDRIKAEPIPKFPSISRDVTLIVDRGKEAQAILDAVMAFEESLVESLHLFDVFEGKPIPKGKKSISFRIIYRSQESTLEDEQINLLHKKIGQRLLLAFDATLPV